MERKELERILESWFVKCQSYGSLLEYLKQNSVSETEYNAYLTIFGTGYVDELWKKYT
jgi:hypothetical protein